MTGTCYLGEKKKKNISDCNCLLGAQCFKSREKELGWLVLMQKLLPSMPSHFSKELFFIKHKVTGCWKRNSVTVNLSTHRPAAWLNHHALIPLCRVCNGQMLFADKEGRFQIPRHVAWNVILQVISASGNTAVLETNIFCFEGCIAITDYSPLH